MKDFFGYDVVVCMNITDIDDKIIIRAGGKAVGRVVVVVVGRYDPKPFPPRNFWLTSRWLVVRSMTLHGLSWFVVGTRAWYAFP